MWQFEKLCFKIVLWFTNMHFLRLNFWCEFNIPISKTDVYYQNQWL